MPVPITVTALPEPAVKNITATADSTKTMCSNYITRLQSGAVNADQIFQMRASMISIKANLGTWKAVAGLDAAAQANIPGYSASLTADTTALQNALQSVVDWIGTNVPTDAQGYVLCYKWLADGTRSVRTFAGGATTGLVTQLQSVLATIG